MPGDQQPKEGWSEKSLTKLGQHVKRSHLADRCPTALVQEYFCLRYRANHPNCRDSGKAHFPYNVQHTIHIQESTYQKQLRGLRPEHTLGLEQDLSFCFWCAEVGFTHVIERTLDVGWYTSIKGRKFPACWRAIRSKERNCETKARKLPVSLGLTIGSVPWARSRRRRHTAPLIMMLSGETFEWMSWADEWRNERPLQI